MTRLISTSSSGMRRRSKDGNRSPATSVARALRALLECGLLLRARLGLVLLLPLGVWHPVDDFPGRLVVHVDAALLGGGPIPFRETVAAEARQIHQVDVLHLGMGAEMLDQGAEGRSLQLGACPVVHADSPIAANSFECWSGEDRLPTQLRRRRAAPFHVGGA